MLRIQKQNCSFLPRSRIKNYNMNLCRRNIRMFFKSLIISALLFAMVFQPLAQIISIFIDFSYELVHVDDVENIEKREQHKDGKNKLQILNIQDHPLEYGIGFSIYSSLNMYCNHYKEIFIPSPDVT